MQTMQLVLLYNFVFGSFSVRGLYAEIIRRFILGGRRLRVSDPHLIKIPTGVPSSGVHAINVPLCVCNYDCEFD